MRAAWARRVMRLCAVAFQRVGLCDVVSAICYGIDSLFKGLWMLKDLRDRIAVQRAIIFVGTGVLWGAAQTPLAGWKAFLQAGIQMCEDTRGASLPVDWASRQRAALAHGDLDELLNVAEAVSGGRAESLTSGETFSSQRGRRPDGRHAASTINRARFH